MYLRVCILIFTFIVITEATFYDDDYDSYTKAYDYKSAGKVETKYILLTIQIFYCESNFISIVVTSERSQLSPVSN